MMDGPIWKGALFSALLLTAAFWDIRRREIPDWIPLLIFLIGIPQMNPPDAFSGLVATGLPYMLAVVLSYKGEDFSIGGGDIKLMAACGFVLGVWGGILQSIAALTLFLVVGIGICVYRGTKKLNTVTLPLAPFFCAGGIFAYCALLFSALI